MQESLFGLLVQFVAGLLTLTWQFVSVLFPLLLPWLPVVLWCVWWLCCVNWKHVWPVLARGGWVPVLLLMYLISLAASYVAPSSCDCLRFVVIPNFWWQFGVVCALVGVALICGYVQEQLHWMPAEVSFDPAPAPGGHGHGHH
jgi:hypothetical protein